MPILLLASGLHFFFLMHNEIHGIFRKNLALAKLALGAVHGLF